MRLTPCNYGLSKVNFRGPRRRAEGKYIAFLGGSETFAKYIETPFPDLVEAAIGEVCVNLGCQSAGPDVFMRDTAVMSLCHDAAMTVIQITGAANLSNTFYKVHPRRNDRFIAPTPKLVALYPEVDFAEIAFTGHLVARLQSVDAERFKIVRATLEQTWLRRMKSLVGQAQGSVVLLWLAPRAPDDDAVCGAHAANDPIFVTRNMVEALRPYVSGIVEVVADHGDTQGMSFPPMETFNAREMMGLAAHRATAKALLAPLLNGLA